MLSKYPEGIGWVLTLPLEKYDPWRSKIMIERMVATGIQVDAIYL
jgi:hypothetical protein